FAVVLTLLAFAVAFVAAAFMMVAFAAVGSTIATSTMGSRSLVILVTRSFTTPVHTTCTIPISIILAITLMLMHTAALPAAAFMMVAFAAVGSTIAASTMGSPSLVILVTRSFTTPVHTTGTIPIAILFVITPLLIVSAAFLAVVVVAVAFVAVAFMAVAFAAV